MFLVILHAKHMAKRREKSEPSNSTLHAVTKYTRKMENSWDPCDNWLCFALASNSWLAAWSSRESFPLACVRLLSMIFSTGVIVAKKANWQDEKSSLKYHDSIQILIVVGMGTNGPRRRPTPSVVASHLGWHRLSLIGIFLERSTWEYCHLIS